MVIHSELMSLWRLGYSQTQIANILNVKRFVICGLWYRAGLTNNRNMTEQEIINVKKHRELLELVKRTEKNEKCRKGTAPGATNVFEPWAVRKARLAAEKLKVN